MFYILLAADPVPFAPDEMPRVVASCVNAGQLKETWDKAREAHPGRALEVTETLFAAEAAIAKAIPAELRRAVEVWNLVAGRVRPKLPAVRAIENYVAPYRAWKKRAGKREYLLEDVVAAVERSPFMFPWVKFSWLLGITEGMLHSDKTLHGFTSNGKERRSAGNGEEFEAREG